jgi:signal transduction histidine kinase
VSRLRPYLEDLALALGLAGASLLIGLELFRPGPATLKLAMQFGSLDAWQHEVLLWRIASIVAVAGLTVRRRWPLLALAAATAAVGSHLVAQGWPMLPIDYAVPVALYTLASLARRRWVPLASLVVLLIGAFVLIFDWQLGTKPVPLRDALWATAGKTYPMLLVLVLAYAVGESARSRRTHVGVLEQRAADLEREQRQRAALAAAAERARITRELHDAVAHGLSVMVVQAQGAAAALERHPDRAAVALQHVIATGRSSLAEMRRLLGVVRNSEPELAPQPRLDALPDLIDRVRAAGRPVRLDITGDPVPLQSIVDLSAFRIVQEALTNTIKHAGTATVVVRLRFGSDRLEIEVTDDGVGETGLSNVDGTGLRGIAERVGMLGGELTVGPCAAGGFRVYATLPLDAAPAAVTT